MAAILSMRFRQNSIDQLYASNDSFVMKNTLEHKQTIVIDKVGKKNGERTGKECKEKMSQTKKLTF